MATENRQLVCGVVVPCCISGRARGGEGRGAVLGVRADRPLLQFSEDALGK
jgi:hypothetical protein